MLSSHLLAGLLALVPAVVASPLAVSTGQNRDLTSTPTDQTTVSTALEQRGTLGRRGFWSRCEECKLVGTVLGCVCTQADGNHIKYSTLDLNKCIGVDEKHNLIWKPNGNFSWKCDKIGAALTKVEVMEGMSLPRLRASCNKEQHRPDVLGSAFINLDEGVHADNGKLVCDGSN